MKKTMVRAILTTTAVLSMSMAAYAGNWQNNETGWQYQNDDGTYPASTWQWIDGNGDGTAESYYFNENGYLLTNTTTPDGYSVNEDGAWVKDGKVQQAEQAATVTPAVVGPSETAQGGTAQEIYLEANKKTAALDSMEAGLKMNLNMNMTVSGEQQNVGATVDMNMKYKGLNSSNIQLLSTVNMDVLGQNMSGAFFYTDGYYYMDIAGQKAKTAMNLDELMAQVKSTTDMTNIDFNYMSNMQMTADENGNHVITYSIDGAALMDQINSIYKTMGLDMSAIQMNIKDMTGKSVIGADGYCRSEQIHMVMDMAAEGDTISMVIDVDMEYKNPGQPVDFAMPSTDGYEEV